MANFRTLFVVSLIGLALALLAYGHSLVDKDLANKQSVSRVTEPGLADAGQTGVRNVDLDDRKPESRSTIEVWQPTGKSRDTPAAPDQVILSGWVGTGYGEIFAGETVVLYSPSQKIRYSKVTGPLGEYKFADIRPGWDYVLKVSPRGMYQSYTRSQLELRSDREEHNVILKPVSLGILTGRIQDPYDRPVADIELSVTSVEKEQWTTRVVTDANGDFNIADFPAGKFQIAIKGQQTIRATGLNFDPDSYLPVILTIDLGPYNLEGGIYDESGRTFDGADVYLIWALQREDVSIRSTRRVSANSNGEFRFTGLGPGKHELTVAVWRGGAIKKSIKQTVDVGVDSGNLMLVVDTL